MTLFDTGIRPVIDEYLAAEQAKVRDYGDYWSASSAGYCQRKVVFERLGVPYVLEDARKQRVFSSGHIFHNWIQEITKNAGLSVAQELELQDEELMIRGHVDDLVLIKITDKESDSSEEYISDHLILYDYKTAHSRSFHYTKDRPISYYHKMQLGTYMFMVRVLQGEKVKLAELDGLPLLEEARVLKISKDDLCMMEHQLLWSKELEKEVLDYWTSLNKYWAEKKLPPCTCADHEGGFMANEKYNPYFYEGSPCSLDWYNEWKANNKEKA